MYHIAEKILKNRTSELYQGSKCYIRTVKRQRSWNICYENEDFQMTASAQIGTFHLYRRSPVHFSIGST